MSWESTVNPDLDTIHVVPVDDLIEHPLNADCVCIPRCEPLEREDGTIGWLYVHHSLDGRESQHTDT